MSNIRRNKDYDRILHEAILNDTEIQRLDVKRAEIYTLAIPQAVLKENGEIETIWLDETNHPLLPKIEALIESRKDQIQKSLRI